MTVGFGSSSTAELEDHLGISGAVPQKKVTFRNNSSKAMSVRSATSSQSQLALFLNCQELTFVANDISTFKQFVTILNPYDFDIRFQVLCTNPNRYELSPKTGRVPAMTSIDLTVRLKETCITSARDGFRFRISEFTNQNNVLGERELPLFLLPDRPARSERPAREPTTRPLRPARKQTPGDLEERTDIEPQQSLLVVMIGVVCLVSLCLPTTGDASQSWVASYLTLSVNQKLIAAFVLGMVTITVLRTK